MIVKLGSYRNNVDFIKHMINRDSGNDIEKAISEAAVATNVPVIVVAYYVGEIKGFSAEISKIIERQMKFYSYQGIEE